MMNFLKQLTWQAIALILGGLVIFAVIVIFAPPDVRPYLFGAHGLISTILGLASDWRRPPGPPLPPPTVVT